MERSPPTLPPTPKGQDSMERMTTRLTFSFCLNLAAAMITAAFVGNAQADDPSNRNDPTFEILGLHEGQTISGGLAVEVQSAHAIRWVEFRVGDYERIERYAPFSLASDQQGRLLELDTDRHLRDGDNALDVLVHFDDGAVSRRSLAFAVNNDPWIEDQAPAPPRDPDPGIWIDIDKYPAVATTGDRVTVQTRGIPDGALVWYHLFDTEWGNVKASSVPVTDGQLELVVPDVPGPRILQLQYPKHYKTNRTIHVRSAPDDDEPWIGIETYPAPATAGDPVTIQTRGIGDGQVIWYQVFDPDWENVISESVPVVNNNIELTVPDAVGPRIVQLQYGNRYKTHRALTITQADQPSGGSTGSGPVIGGEQGPPLEMAGPINITTHGTRVENVKIVLPHDARRFAPAVRIAADNVTLRNVEIVGPDNGRGWGVVFSPNAKRARLTEVLVRGFHDGVLLRGEGHRFERCVFTGMHQHDSGQTPATLVGTDARDVRFEHCVFHGLTANDHHADQARHVVLSKPWKAKANSDTQQHDHALGVRFEKCVVADGPSGAFAMGTGGSFTDGIIGPFNAPSFIAPPGGAVSGNFVFFDTSVEDADHWFVWNPGIGRTLGTALFEWREQTRNDAGVLPHPLWRKQWIGVMLTVERSLLDAVINTLHDNLKTAIENGQQPQFDLAGGGTISDQPQPGHVSDGNDDGQSGDDSPIPADLRALPASDFVPGKTWRGDRRFEKLRGRPWSQSWGNWAASGSQDRLFIDGGEIDGGDDHKGQPFKGWSGYYFRGVTFRGLQWATESNAGTKRGAMIDCEFYDVREDAIRNLTGHIENVTVHSARPRPGAHADTIQLAGDIDGLTVRNLRSDSGDLHGIILNGAKNVVIDGFVHKGPNVGSGWSILFQGDAENVTIRNCKLSGAIIFRGKQTNVHIDHKTVQQNVKNW